MQCFSCENKNNDKFKMGDLILVSRGIYEILKNMPID
jgi:hypothetical protein